MQPCHPLGTLAQSPGDSPGVGGTYPSQPTLGLFSANLAQNRGFSTRRQHQSNASSSLSAEEGGRVVGGVGVPTAPAERSALGVFEGEGTAGTAYQQQSGWGSSMPSPASLQASSHLGTDTAPRLQPGWGTQCAAYSWRRSPDLKRWGGMTAAPKAEGDPLLSPHPMAGPGGPCMAPLLWR